MNIKRRQTLITTLRTIFSRETPCYYLQLFHTSNRLYFVWVYRCDKSTWDVRRAQENLVNPSHGMNNSLALITLSSIVVSVLSLANYCSQSLRNLKLSFCTDISDDTVVHLAKNCKRWLERNVTVWLSSDICGIWLLLVSIHFAWPFNSFTALFLLIRTSCL